MSADATPPPMPDPSLMPIGRVVEALLYDIKPGSFDAITVPILTLALVALISSLPPALRAARVDPAETLRSE